MFDSGYEVFCCERSHSNSRKTRSKIRPGNVLSRFGRQSSWAIVSRFFVQYTSRLIESAILIMLEFTAIPFRGSLRLLILLIILSYLVILTCQVSRVSTPPTASLFRMLVSPFSTLELRSFSIVTVQLHYNRSISMLMKITAIWTYASQAMKGHLHP